MSDELTKVNPATTELAAALPPEGYDVVALGMTTKWASIEQGQPIEGILLGRETLEDDDGERGFYHIRLLKPCKATYKDDNGATVTETVDVGGIVAVGERSKIEMLTEWCNDGGKHQVYLLPVKQIKLKGGRTMWQFTVGHKVLENGKGATLVNGKQPR